MRWIEPLRDIAILPSSELSLRSTIVSAISLHRITGELELIGHTLRGIDET
jgi:hypothetical protein